MNIEIEPGIALHELKGKPLTIVVEIVPDEHGLPALRAVHPQTLTRRKQGGFHIERVHDRPYVRR